MAIPQVWFRKNGGNWNANPSADPVAKLGGVSVAGAAGQTFFITAQGADSTILLNAGASDFANTAPTGYFPGWPDSVGGFTTFSPAKNGGSGVLSNGNLTLSCPTIFGAGQVTDGVEFGDYYFELTNVFNSFFTDFAGGGVARGFPGLDYSKFVGLGAYSLTDVNGGAGVTGATTGISAHAASCGTIVIDPVFSALANGDVIGIAFTTGLTQPGPPLPPEPILGGGGTRARPKLPQGGFIPVNFS